MAKQPLVPTCFTKGPEGQLLTGVGPKVGYEFAKAYFPKAQHSLRIATAYFSLKGYNLVRKFFQPNAQLFFIVGKRDEEHVQTAIREEIKKELKAAGSENLYAAVTDILNRIKYRAIFDTRSQDYAASVPLQILYFR